MSMFNHIAYSINGGLMDSLSISMLNYTAYGISGQLRAHLNTSMFNYTPYHICGHFELSKKKNTICWGDCHEYDIVNI